ncbi:MAG: carboxypeptidase regulatory-like domain-containing protein [Pyrinomonadaceae bacterium]
MGFSSQVKRVLTISSFLLCSFSAAAFAAPVSGKNIVIEKGNLGIIKGVVRDEAGNAIADATVAIFRGSTSKLLKQVSSARDGSFIAKIIPGKYTVLAVAQGFNPVTLFGVEVARSTELVYGFKLERAGSGNTLPEKRVDRNSSKWRIRAAQSQRSIYQNQEGETSAVAENPQDADKTEDTTEPSTGRKAQTVVDTYFAGTSRGNYAGVNLATLLPINSDSAVIFAAQTAKGRDAPLRFETAVKYSPSSKHQVRITASAGKLGSITNNGAERTLGQFSLAATDEWQFRDGVILVFGFDYSRFVGAGDDVSLSPRLGLQFDLDSKTRGRAAFTSQTEEKSWANAIDLEGERIAFTEPVAIEDLVIVGEKPQMNKSRRLEFGIERILSERSSIDASAFFDTTFGRGVNLTSISFDELGAGFSDVVANQQGSARGARIVYTRRIGSILSASGGYAIGNGQQLSASAISDPSRIFESSFFQSFFGQVAADLKTGTSIRTIYRLSPQATVFAIDPFKGRLAIYDPGLSVYVTQHVPTFGLPFRAEAIVDARNLFDFANGITTDEGSLILNAQRRMVRGGIQVRF